MKHKNERVFDLSTPQYRLRCEGVIRRVKSEFWKGEDVAASVSDILNSASAAAQVRNRGQAPVVVGAIPFDTRSPAQLYLPRKVDWSTRIVHLTQSANAKTVRALKTSAGAFEYQSAVQSALDRIHMGELEKVVLARRIEIRRNYKFDIEEIRARLATQNPEAYTFRMDLEEESSIYPASLVGASPELVLASRNRKVVSHPLAGSAQRHPELQADLKAGDELLLSKKDLSEHAHVVRAVVQAFKSLADEVEVPEGPSLVATPVIWHLGTRVSGWLRKGVLPLQLAYAMHPTPAVCGWPSEEARRMIERLENFSRGFYAGLIGWTDAEGNGEWALTLRCGILRGNRAILYAGAGVVENSTPETENTETDVKFSTFSRALG